MRKYFLLALALALATVGALQEEEEGWTRPAVVKALLVHIENVGLNCSLTMLDSQYPLIYPGGRGSSHQFVVGCRPTSAGDLNDSKYLWQLQDFHSEVSLPLVQLLHYCALIGREHW